MRMLVFLMAAMLWCLPQATYTYGVNVVCDEYGAPAPAPAGEEEEVKHTKLHHSFSHSSDVMAPQPPLARAPHTAHAMFTAALQEVPYPPPRG